jgi:GT2 family glycosyltransferase
VNSSKLNCTNPAPPIIIINYLSVNHLELCIDALNRQTVPSSNIFIFDNATLLKNKRKLLKLKANNVSILLHKKNIGFALANNIALHSVPPSSHFICLNPDTIPEPDWLENLMEDMKAHPDVASYGSLLTQANQPHLYDGVGDCLHFTGIAWRKWHGKPIKDHPVSSGQVFSNCAAAVCYHRETFEALGGFDERFFCYLEDVDFGLRLQKNGFKNRLVSSAVVKHIGSGSTEKRGDFSSFYGNRNLELLYFKNFPWVLMLLFLPFHCLAIVALAFVYAWRGQLSVYLKSKKEALPIVIEMLTERLHSPKLELKESLRLLSVLTYGFRR